MAKQPEKHTIVGEVELIKVPYQVSDPVYVKKEMPEYVLVKQEITYKVPRIEYENKTYEKPVLVEKEYVIPKYIEKVYEIPVYKEVSYEVPVKVEKEYIIPIVKYENKEQVTVKEVPYTVSVPNYIKEDIIVKHAVVQDIPVVNAKIKHVTIEALHPKYICHKCRKNEVDPVGGSE